MDRHTLSSASPLQPWDTWALWHSRASLHQQQTIRSVLCGCEAQGVDVTAAGIIAAVAGQAAKCTPVACNNTRSIA